MLYKLKAHRNKRLRQLIISPKKTGISDANTGYPCSQTLYFLFKVRRARATKNREGFIGRQHKGVGVGEEDRHLWEQLKLAFPRKSKLPLAERRLSCHHHVNDSLRSRHASRSVCHGLEALTYYCNLHKTKTSVESAAGCSHTELVLTMLTISFVSEYRLWKARLTTVWHRFQANTYSKKSGARLFWVYWGKRILWPFLPQVLGKF